jgi:DNA-directed RNA polymerase subunit K/omega
MDQKEFAQLVEKAGGQHRMTQLVQRRLSELARGDAPRIENPLRNLVEVAIEEFHQGKFPIEARERGREREPAREGERRGPPAQGRRPRRPFRRRRR